MNQQTPRSQDESPKTYNVARQLTIRACEKDTAFKCEFLSSAKEAAEYARQFYFDDIAIYESFFIILVNQAHRAIGWAKISQGGCAATVVDVKIVAKYAVDCLAAGVLLVHNHPSGNTRPSPQDDNITRRNQEALALFDIKLLDSLILAPEEGYYSYADNGRL